MVTLDWDWAWETQADEMEKGGPIEYVTWLGDVLASHTNLLPARESTDLDSELYTCLYW
jgi:hypothetical protein